MIAWLEAYFIACLRACLREPHIGRSRVFHGKLLADGKL
jgi:hypothetical protein